MKNQRIDLMRATTSSTRLLIRANLEAFSNKAEGRSQ